MKALLCLSIVCTQLYLQMSCAAEPIGRLFSSPNERSNLDYLRQTKKVNVPAVINEAPVERIEQIAPAPVVLPDAINLQGYVKRNDGKQGTVWINDKAVSENSSNKEVQVGHLNNSNNQVPIKLTANGKQLKLKAGQVYTPKTNKIREARSRAANVERGKIDGNNY